MRLSVLIYVPSARRQLGRRSARSRNNESSARPPVLRILAGSLVRFVALLVRFTGKFARSCPQPALEVTFGHELRVSDGAVDDRTLRSTVIIGNDAANTVFIAGQLVCGSAVKTVSPN